MNGRQPPKYRLVARRLPPWRSVTIRPEGRARATAWTPARVSGLLAWYTAGPAYCFTDAAGTTPCAAGDTVACWKDRSGAARHLTQATAANRPTLRLVSGKYAVQFDAANDAMQWTGTGVGAASAATIGGAFRNVDGTAVGNRFGPRLRDSAAGNLLVNLWAADKLRAADGAVTVDSVAAAGLTDRVGVVLVGGSALTCRLGGVAAATASTQPARNVNTIDVAFDGPLGGYAWGFAAYSAALAGDDLLALEAYLATLHP